LLGIVAGYFAGLPMTIRYQMKYHLFDLRKEILPLPAILAGMLLAEGGNLIVKHFWGP
jgi:hypothetical protein